MPALPTPQTVSRRAWLSMVGIATLAGSGLLCARRQRRPARGLTVHLLLPEAGETDPQPYRVGTQWVLGAILETLVPGCIAEVPSLRATQMDLRPGAFQIQINSRRIGDHLELSFRSRGRGETWQHWPGVAATPFQAFSGLVRQLPFPVNPGLLPKLLPEQGETIWELIDLVQAKSYPQVLTSGSRFEALVARAPGSGLAWCLAGMAGAEALYRRRDWSAEDRAKVEGAFRKALDLVPGLPSAAGNLAQFLSNLGDPSGALEVLPLPLRLHPDAEVLLGCLAYAARNAGLLGVARRAVDQRESLMGGIRGIENTLLYLGEFDRFDEGLLRDAALDRWGPAHRFYLGYSALVRGDFGEALRRLRSGGEPWGESRFGRMGEALHSLLEGHRDRAREVLDELVDRHLGLRAPDGEFIFKLAEFMALFGELPRALELAVRAASHGFSCAEWFDRAPLLAPIRAWPRYQAILHALRDRVAHHGRRFPPRLFGL